MYTESYLRYLLSDDISLQRYYKRREPVSLDDIKRSLMLIERENNRHIPDHYYRLGLAKSFEDITCISHLFTVGLVRLASGFLELRNGGILVKAEKMNGWQMMLPYMPPLLLDCIILWQAYVLEDGKEIQYIHDHFLPNFSFTAYPSPYIPQLTDFLEADGLTDLHMHLNGSLETDLTWQDFLQNPLEIKVELDKAFSDGKVKEQYAQFSMLSDPDKFFNLLNIASVLRYLLFTYAYGESTEAEIEGSFEDLLDSIADGRLYGGFVSFHPMEKILGEGIRPHFLEGILYIRLLQTMSIHPENDIISGLFHYYLLILGLANKMMVQQPTSYGFEEFQKITLNGLREYSEAKDYSRRFAQLSGNELRNIKLLEGRFSPKDTIEKNESLLDNILSGWDNLRRLQQNSGLKESSLKLVAHFIKKADNHPDLLVRHKQLRDDLSHRAELLIQLQRFNSDLQDVFVGIDAAASEFDAPPEVFAPAYRRLRESGFYHFTYHAGEDFFHILSGLRAIYEAITFLCLQRCDRIGHATATGVPVRLWHDNIGDRMLIRQGEHLDNLLFAYHLISESGDDSLKSMLPMLSLKIDEYSYGIYQKYFPAFIHISAWKNRYKDPRDVNVETNNSGKGMTSDELFLQYHRLEVVKRYNKIIEVDTYEVLDEEQLTKMQLLMLKEMHQREIVIETLPTSNVIIGNHHDFSTYHLYNWYRWKKEGYPLPPIVVGTDDTGIFATNIYNEYCNIYCQFLYEKEMNADDITAFLRELDTNARHYAFNE